MSKPPHFSGVSARLGGVKPPNEAGKHTRGSTRRQDSVPASYLGIFLEKNGFRCKSTRKCFKMTKRQRAATDWWRFSLPPLNASTEHKSPPPRNSFVGMFLLFSVPKADRAHVQARQRDLSREWRIKAVGWNLKTGGSFKFKFLNFPSLQTSRAQPPSAPLLVGGRVNTCCMWLRSISHISISDREDTERQGGDRRNPQIL